MRVRCCRRPDVLVFEYRCRFIVKSRDLLGVPQVSTAGFGYNRACAFKRSTSTSLSYSQHLYHTISCTMSVLLETSAGDITIDLLVKETPKCCEK